MFKKATKEKLKARIALDGPAGSGKTYTALRFAFALAGKGGRVAVIDTEHRSASKYVGESPDGFPFQFDVCELEHYSPTTLKNVVDEAGKRYDVILIDSLSHFWEGTGGALQLVDKKKASSKGGGFSAWSDINPLLGEMMKSMLNSPAHIIATMRTKMAYDVEKNEKGKLEVTKIGLKPVQREGLEYEFDLVGDIDLEHILTVSKTRCSPLDGAKAEKPGPEFVVPLITWLNTGVDPAPRAEIPEPAPDPATQEGSDQNGARKGVRLSGKPATDPHKQHESEPCGEDLAERIKVEAQRLEMPTDKLKQIMSRNGANKLAELPHKEAAKLLSRLQAMAADAPF